VAAINNGQAFIDRARFDIRERQKTWGVTLRYSASLFFLNTLQVII
jgi:hypothetical protein